MRKHPDRDDQNISIPGNDLSSELFDNFDREEQEKRRRIYPLRKSLQYLFGGDSFPNYHSFTQKEMETGQGAGLHTIIKYNNEDTLVYIGSGEFNTDIFNNNGGIPELKGLRNTPLPLFIISQADTYDLERNGIETDVQDYLKKKSIIVMLHKGEAYINSYGPRKNQIDFNNMNIKHLKDAINEVRLAILHKEFPNGHFQTGQNNCIKIIQEFQEMDSAKFYSTVWTNRKFIEDDNKEDNPKGYNMNKLLDCLRHMGLDIRLRSTGDKAEYESLHNLIKSFNLQKQSF